MWCVHHFTATGKSPQEAQEKMQSKTDAFFTEHNASSTPPKDVKIEAAICYCPGQEEPFCLYCTIAHKHKACDTDPTTD